MGAFQSGIFDSGVFAVVGASDVVTLVTNLPGGNADYVKYLMDLPVKTDRSGNPAVLDFTLIPYDASFVKPGRGTYINLSTTLYTNWFTGFITNDPEMQFLGKDGITKLPVFGYKFQATDDSYLLSLKPIGLIPPFINSTTDQIVKYLVSLLDTYSVFDVSGIKPGPLLARYIVDPNKKFQDIITDLCNISAFRFRANNYKLYFEANDAVPATITIDGNSVNFTPARLSIRPTTDPIVNDCIVTGAPEPENFITEWWIGDGATGEFPLLSGLYGADGATLISDPFSGSTIDTQNWNIYDNGGSHFQLYNGYLNVLGGSANGSFDVHLDSAKVLPLEATLRLTHGQWDFVSTGAQTVAGIIGALWTQTPNAAMTGCVYGLNVAKSGTNLVLSPIVNGVVDNTQSFTIDFTKRYVIRTLCNFSRAVRQDTTYAYLSQSGTVGNYGGTAKADTVTYSTFLYEYDPVTVKETKNAQFVNAGVAIAANTAYATYIPVAANDLHATFMGVTVSVPMQGSLAIQPKGGPSYVPKILGVNEIDSLDGLAPVATIITDGGTGQTQNNGLGTPLFNPGDAKLAFFKDSVNLISTIPNPGDLVRLQYRRCAISAGRVQSPSSIISEALEWGDDGYRSLTRSDIKPQPRTSAECELAAAALIQDSGFQHFEGDYTQYSPYEFTGEPQSGTVLKFQNLPVGFPSYLSAEIINQVVSTLHLTNPAYFDHKVSFGKPTNIQKAIARFYRTEDQINFGVNVDWADMPTAIQLASIGLVNIDDVPSCSLVSFDANNYNFNTNQAAPTGGGFEIRLTDESWGADDAKNLVIRTSGQTFSVPRNAHGKVCFVKAYDGRNKILYSEDFTNAVWQKSSATVTNATDVNPLDQHSQISTIALASGGYVFQDTSYPVLNDAGVFTVSVKGTAGQSCVVKIANTSATVLASKVVTFNGHWQRVSVTYTGTPSDTGNFRVLLGVNASAVTFSATWASFEEATTETGYFKTNGTAYGAMSRYASGLRVNYPLVPAAPTATINATDPFNPVVNVVLPSTLQDVWGIEIRASDNVTVLYNDDIIDAGYNPSFTVKQNTSRSLSYWVYTQNLLGEYSTGYNVTASIPIPDGVGNWDNVNNVSNVPIMPTATTDPTVPAPFLPFSSEIIHRSHVIAVNAAQQSVSLPNGSRTHIMVGNLYTDDQYMDHFQAEMHTDTSGSNRVGVAEIRGIWDSTNNRMGQRSMSYFENAIVGTTYYFRVAVIDKFGNQSLWSAWISLVAGDTTVPSPTYSPTASPSPGGVAVKANPASPPANVDHYEFFWNTTNTAPTVTSLPNLPPSSDGTVLFVLNLTETGYLWVRACDTKGSRQAWTSLGAFTPSAVALGTGTTGNLDNVPDGTIFIRGAQYTAGDFVVENGNFEASASLPVPGWVGDTGATLGYETVSPQSGNQSLKITVPAVQFAGAQTIKLYTVVPGEGYKISGYVKSDGTTQVYIQIWFFDKNGVFVNAIHAAFTTSTSWTFLSATGVVPANAVGARVQISNGAAVAGTMWADNIVVVRQRSLDDEVTDGSTYQKILATQLQGGYHKPLALSSQNTGLLDEGTTIATGHGGVNTPGWYLVATGKINIGVNVNSLKVYLEPLGSTTASSCAPYSDNTTPNVGFWIGTGTPPANPTITAVAPYSLGAYSPILTGPLSNPPAGLITIALYVNYQSVGAGNGHEAGCVATADFIRTISTGYIT